MQEGRLGDDSPAKDSSIPTTVVTGGAGFLGSHLCEALLERGHRVLCVDNLDTGSLTNIEHLRDERFVFIQHDLVRAPRRSTSRSTSCSTSPARPARSTTCGCRCTRSRSAPTARTTRSAWPRLKRARFLLASTSEVYGDPLVHPQPESYWGNVNPIGPRGVYDEAKRYAEALTMAYHRQQGVDTAIVRIFNTYGPRMRADDGRAIPTFVRQALEGEPHHGLRRRQPDALVLLRRRPDRGHRAARRVRRARAREHRQPVRVHAARAGPEGDRPDRLEIRPSCYEALPVNDPKQRRPDITRARELLGWEPRSSSTTDCAAARALVARAARGRTVGA